MHSQPTEYDDIKKLVSSTDYLPRFSWADKQETLLGQRLRPPVHPILRIFTCLPVQSATLVHVRRPALAKDGPMDISITIVGTRSTPCRGRVGSAQQRLRHGSKIMKDVYEHT